MKEIIVNFADIYIKIHTQYDYMEQLCKDYLSDQDYYDIEVYPSEDYMNKVKDTALFTNEYCESLSLYEEIGKQLPQYNAFIMHGAAITYKDQALIFTAKSGTGKTTHIRLWKKYFKSDVDMINGDKPILRFYKEGVKVYGTPFCGKEQWHKNRSQYLSAICLIEQAKVNKIEKLKPADAMVPLYTQIYFSKTDEQSADQTISLFNQLLTQIPLYKLECNISEQAVITAYKGMINNE